MSPTRVYGCNLKLIKMCTMSSCLLGPGNRLLLSDTPSEFFALASNTIRHFVEILSNLKTPWYCKKLIFLSRPIETYRECFCPRHSSLPAGSEWEGKKDIACDWNEQYVIEIQSVS